LSHQWGPSHLDRRGILLKDAGAFFEAETARLKAHAKALATTAADHSST
jgi:hypothetical protein